MTARPFVLLYIADESWPKLMEWQRILRRYGIDVRGIHYPTKRVEDTAPDAERRLRAGEPGLLGVMVDNSKLVVPGTERPAPQTHLAQVEHLCRVQFFWLDGGTPRVEIHEGRVRGYLDLREGLVGGWWDDRFRMDETGTTLTEWREKTGSKVSARDLAAERFVSGRIRGSLRDFQFIGVVPGRPVSFDRLVLEDADEHPFFADPSVDRFGLRGLFRAVANMGVHFRAPADKRSGPVLWDPGLHGGLPTSQKDDPFHESVYFAHDIGHQLIPRGMFEGTDTERLRRVNLITNMLSEAFTMVLADMGFADAIRSSGHPYDYAARGIWPLLEAAGLSGAPIPHDRLLELMLANGLFAVTGSTEAWERIVSGPGAMPAVDRFRSYYAKFFRADLVWNAANWRDMTRRSDEFRRWWNLVGPIVRANRLGLQTLPELADASDASDGDDTETLVRKIGTYLFETRIRPILANPPAPEPRERVLNRAFARWMCGQLLAYVRYDFLPEVREEAQTIADALYRNGVRTADDVERIRSFFERRIDRLAERGMLPAPDAAMWKEMVPHVEPKFVGYRNVAETHAEAARRLLEGRTDDKEPGVCLRIRDRETGRTILQRKDYKHPTVEARGRLSMFGGSVEPGENPEDALPRELEEEFANALLVAEITGCARYVRRFRLSADPWPGLYDLYVFDATVDTETFDRWARALSEPGAVLEGMAVVMDSDDLAGYLEHPSSFLCAHDAVLKETSAPSV